jgi:hypothetical protein
MTEPSIKGLLNLLTILKQNELSDQITETPALFDIWKQMTKEDWEKYYGLAGIHIFNYLNPKIEGIRVLFAGHEMDIDVPFFDSTNFENSFPFFDSSVVDYLKRFKDDALVGRDDQIRQVNEILSYRAIDKYHPLICSTSRGMGKTAFMVAIGMQAVKLELKNPLILDAIATGRIISFDFASRNAVPEEKDIEPFFTRLMVYFLCRMFDGCQVDGIYFQFVEFNDIILFRGKQKKFDSWKSDILKYGADRMMEEYIRLTNIAFGVKCTAPPVFLLDEVQGLCKPTNVQSLLKENQVVYHSFLSLLLTQLAGNYKPVCICTGTNNGNIVEITEKSRLIPFKISLTTLHTEKDCKTFWNQRTLHLNANSALKVQIQDGDEDWINAFIYTSYQIPRLMMLAHFAWFQHKSQSHLTDRISPLQSYEVSAGSYYAEMTELLFNPKLKAEDIAHIIMCCGVRWKVGNIYAVVPGTEIPWEFLIENSLVFPYVEGCYLFPFSLLWLANTPSVREKGDYSKTRAELEIICQQKVFNLDIKDMYVSYDKLRQLNLYNLGICYEKLFVSCLATKYYLQSVVEKKKTLLFSEIYEFGEDKINHNLMMEIEVDFSQGISLPDDEVFIDTENLPSAVVHNIKRATAHHDIILPAKQLTTRNNIVIPVSCKSSFRLSPDKVIERQLKLSKQNANEVDLLIWLYKGQETREKKYQGKIGFLNGAGCCNGLALDMFILTKKLISQNNKLC